MEIVPLLPELHLVKPAFGQVYLWRDDSEVSMVDTGVPGSAEDLAAAFAELGYRRSELRRVILTHHHEDHMGAAADVRTWGDVEVLAHRLEAPVIRGERPGAPRQLTDRERVLFEQMSAGVPPAPPCPVDTELEDGDSIDFGGGAEVMAVPGHTDGSIVIRLARHGVLFTGDLVVGSEDGPYLGPFNTDRALARESFLRVARVPAQIVAYGHGDPLTDPAEWRALGERCQAGPNAVPDPFAMAT